MNNRAHEIIGVLPAFPQFPNINDVYMAIPSCPWRSGETALTNRSARFLAGFGKLREDIDVEQSATEMSAIAERISVAYPADYPPELGFGSTTLLLRNELVKGSSSYLLILLGTTLMVLLISCANVTNLILSQHAKRQREFAVRASLGATRGMLAKQLLLESILLALMGGLLGLALSWLGIDVLRGFALHFTTRSSQIMINSEVMIFVLVISLITGIVAGVVPSLARQKLVTSLKEGGKASVSSEANPIRNGLLIVQFGLSLTLLVAAGLSIKSLAEIDRVEPGFDPNQTEATQLDLNWTSYPNPPDQWQFTQNILREVRALPYVSEAGAGLTYPMDSFAAGFNQVRGGIQFDDRPFDPNFVLDSTYLRPVSGGYFDALGIDLLQGRAFSDHDDAQAPLVAVISRATALSLWPGPDVIDKQFSFDNGITWTRIIGVVDDTKEQGLTGETGQKIYLPLAQSPALHVAVVARLAQGSTTYRQDFRDLLKRLDAQQAISRQESLNEAIDNSISLQQFIAQLLIIFAAVAVLITVSGVSGVLAYLISIRTREIGIRMAIGASQRDVLLMVLAHGLRLSAAGLLIGLFGAWYVAGSLSAHLFNVTATDVGIYVMALGSLFLIAVAACLVPSYRASSMDPNLALRTT